MRKIAPSYWLLSLTLCLSPYLAACSGDTAAPPLGLLDSPQVEPSSSSDPSAELERISQLQRIKVVPIDEDGNDLPAVSINSVEIETQLSEVCFNQITGGSGSCGTNLRQALQYLCTSHKLLSFIEPSSGFVLPAGVPGLPADAVQYRFQEQSQAANAALAKSARQIAALGTTDLIRGLARTTGEALTFPEVTSTTTPCSDADQQFGTSGQTVREKLTTTLVEAYGLFEEATRAEVTAIVAFGDAQRSNPSISQGVEDGVLAVGLSRAAAAHRLVGGGPSLFLIDSWGSQPPAYSPVCTRPNLTPGGREALAVLRESALSPHAVFDGDLTTDELLNVARSDGSVKQRLVAFSGDNSSNATLSVETRLGLSPGDFAEAREYLQDEIRAYHRSFDAGTPGGGGYLKFGATGLTPVAPEPAFYRAIVSGSPHNRGLDPTSPDPNAFLFSYYFSEEDTLALNSGYVDLANYIDLVGTRLQSILNADRSISYDDDDNSQTPAVQIPVSEHPAYAPLAALYGMANARRVGRLVLINLRVDDCNASSEDCVATLPLVSGVRSNAKYALAIGEDTMNCAAHGAVEGAPCDPANVLYKRLIPLNSAQNESGAGFSESSTVSNANFNAYFHVSGIQSPTTQYLHPGERVYVLKPRNAIDPAGAVGNYRPGSYEVLGAGVVPPLPEEDGDTTVHVAPLIPDLDQEVAKLMMPSASWCTQQSVHCSGATFDERLPLENELTSDGDPKESSWRHYLELARAAAEEADALGSEMISQGIALDQQTEQQQEAEQLREEAQRIQVEQTLEEIQNVCGTSIDPQVLMSGFSTNPQANTLDKVLDAPCDDSSDCTTNYRCYGGRCILDPVQLASNTDDEDAQRLARCIGADHAPIPLVTTGVQPVCVWHINGDENSLCELTDADKLAVANGTLTPPPCPNIAGEDGNDPAEVDGSPCPTMLPAGMQSNYTTKLVKTTLNFFDNSDKGQAEVAKDMLQRQHACDFLKVMRNAVAGGLTLQNLPAVNYSFNVLRTSNIFHPESLKLVANSLGWEPSINGYSSITVNGAVRYTTGRFGATASNDWPCNPDARMDGYHTTLFGERLGEEEVNCESEAFRGYINRRMRDAVIAAKATTTNDLTGIFFPTSVTPGGTSYRSLFGSAPGAPIVNTQLFVDHYSATTTTPSLIGYHAGGAEWDFWIDSNAFPWTSYGTSSFLPATSFPATGNAYNWPVRIPSVDGILLGSVFGTSFDPVKATWTGSWNDPAGANSEIPEGIRTAYGNFPGFEDIKFPMGLMVQALFGVELDFGEAVTSGRWYPQPDLFHDDFYMTKEVLLDAAELMCDVQARPGLAPAFDPAKPPIIATTRDLDKAAMFLQGAADAIIGQAAVRVLADFPEYGFDAVRREGPIGASPALGGLLAEAVSDLRVSLIDLFNISPKIASQLRLFAQDISVLRGILERNGLQRDINTLQFLSTTSQQMANCANAVSAAGGLNSLVEWGNASKSIATCANSIAQVAIADAIRDKENDIAKIDDQLAFSDFASDFEIRSQTLADLSSEGVRLAEQLDGKLAEIERLRASARRALDRAILMDSFQLNVHYFSNTAMRNRLNGLTSRYNGRLKDAKRLSYLAKRAVEQRLGINLSEMNFDLPLVDAPSRWESKVCDMQGVNYNRLREEAVPYSTVGDFASGFIGDYVDDLEKVVESYVLVNNFHEGADTAVMSLKEDIVKPRVLCEQPSRNLLTQTGDMTQLSTDSTVIPGWEITGCTTEMVNDVAVPKQDCISVSADASLALPTGDDGVPGFLIQRGPRCGGVFSCSEPGVTTPTCAPGGCGLNNNARLRQVVDLHAGTYRLSYYTMINETDPAGEIFGLGAVRVLNGNGDELADALDFEASYLDDDEGEEPETLADYTRVYADFTLGSAQSVVVEIGPDRLAALHMDSSDIHAFQTQTITGMMLEETTGRVLLGIPLDSPFMKTGATLTTLEPVCNDTSGVLFQKQGWQRRCLSLCNNGFGDNCPESGTRSECFWELNFGISQRLIESGRQLQNAGFAKGNFNYRIGNVGVNFVGTGIRDCTDQPTSCNGAGFIQYSLSHDGPFFVRNHFGGSFQAKLFNGNIEHARGLATERYVTNPLSDADRGLLQDYMRGEFNGRPLDGNFVLRIWEDPSLDLSKIEDIQIVMNYGYWTRFN